MESMGEGMKKLMAQFLYVVETPCPMCGGEMHAWKEKEGAPPRCPPVCVSCKYKSKDKKEAIQSKKLFENSMKAKAVNYLRYQSVLPNKGLLDCRMDGFRETDEETAAAKQKAGEIIQAILEGKPVHATFTGKTGTGKTHLGMSILWEVTEQSSYQKKCLFVSYPELLEQMRFSMKDERLQKEIMGTLQAEIKVADVLLLDDIGAELGDYQSGNEPATDFNVRTLTGILDARQDKPTIITTNLAGKQIKQIYGARVLSRMVIHSEGWNIKMANATDKRMAKA